MKLLTIGGNTKIGKSDASGEYLTAILHLAPGKLSGVNMCPSASKGCLMACLNTAGRGQFASIQQARINKTRFFNEDTAAFMAQLRKELAAFQKKCAKLGRKPVVRLNGTSDILWERETNLFEAFPLIQFYDYTKIAARMAPSWEKPANYHLTFSRSESNEDKALGVLRAGGNVAVVFSGKLPETWHGYPVHNGDATDLRFLDPAGVVVGLTAKGKAKKDTSGFVVAS